MPDEFEELKSASRYTFIVFGLMLAVGGVALFSLYFEFSRHGVSGIGLEPDGLRNRKKLWQSINC